ncbi:MAG: hypothetical protein RO469_18270 [Thermincola sp.]|jgi:hypothetical protein|nr:hypothetical protein [Thermincola sp.]MDT3704307.1 hypothetical protein [Thermincola sp.]
MKIYKRWTIKVLLTTLLTIKVLILINFIIDPLQFYHSAFYKPVFSKQQRYQNPGLVKNYKYDTIIIGSSMSENNVPSYLNAKMEVNALKLSIMGSSAKEQYLIAKLALDTGKAKNVIWVVDYFSMRGDPTRVRDEYGAFPFYMYDNNPINDIKYLLNLDTSKQAFNILAVMSGLKPNENPDLDTLNTWGNKENFSRQSVLKEWAKYKQTGPIAADEYEITNIKRNLDENLFSLIKNYPQTTFYLYYPPYSILQHRYYFDKNPVLFENELTMNKYIFGQVGKLPNVKIYNFQQENRITFNLDNYKDLAHHTPKINEWIIDQISKNSYRVTENNLEHTLEMLRNQVETLDENKL